MTKGQKIGELESDKSIFDFEAPCDGLVRSILIHPGEARPSGTVFLQIETADASLAHLRSKSGLVAPPPPPAAAPASASAVWTPRAIKLAQEAGLDPAKVTDIAATGPGGRVSGDDVAHYLERRRP